jgi:hypothetical protein
MSLAQFWSAAGSEAPRRFGMTGSFQLLFTSLHPEAVSPLRSVTALHKPA